MMLFIVMLQQAITDLFCFGAKSPGVCLFVCLFLRHIHKLNSNSQPQEVVIYFIFEESVNLKSLMFKCISLTE